MRADIRALQTAMGPLRADMGGLKTDLRALRTDMGTVKTGLRALRTDIGVVKTDLANVRIEVAKLPTRDDLRELVADKTEAMKGRLVAWIVGTGVGVAALLKYVPGPGP